MYACACVYTYIRIYAYNIDVYVYIYIYMYICIRMCIVFMCVIYCMRSIIYVFVFPTPIRVADSTTGFHTRRVQTLRPLMLRSGHLRGFPKKFRSYYYCYYNYTITITVPILFVLPLLFLLLFLLLSQ